MFELGPYADWPDADALFFRQQFDEGPLKLGGRWSSERAAEQSGVVPQKYLL